MGGVSAYSDILKYVVTLFFSFQHFKYTWPRVQWHTEWASFDLVSRGGGCAQVLSSAVCVCVCVLLLRSQLGLPQVSRSPVLFAAVSGGWKMINGFGGQGGGRTA